MDPWERLSSLSLDTPDLAVAAAVLIPLYEDEDGRLRVVLIKRPDHMPTHAGQLAFPGGWVAEVDEGPLDTALREAEEEVGIAPDEVTVLGALDPVRAAAVGTIVLPFVGRLAKSPVLRPDPSEVERVLEPLLEPFFDEEAWRSEEWNGRRLWFFELGEDVLWGASAHMLRQLLVLIR